MDLIKSITGTPGAKIGILCILDHVLTT